MKSIFMRVLFCKIHCPSFICFCKPSAAAHLYTSGPLKLDNTPHVLPLGVEPLTTTATADNNTNSTDQDESCLDDQKCLDDEKLQQASEVLVLKSCIRRNKEAAPEPTNDGEKKRVQWVDNIGKDLADIKEFESSEIWDIDYDEDSRGCVCVIL